MCGICGVALPWGHTIPERRMVAHMRDVMRHRGPDGEGMFLEEGVGLGHRRLSIIDPAHGAQPMHSDDGRYVVVYNGEVFNHPDLKRGLEADGASYRTRCDTETVLKLFERYREQMAHQIRGMFAIAIWDRERRELFLLRDRLGVKPLYYMHREDGALFFASEVKALVSAGAIRPTLAIDALPELLANRSVTGSTTLFEGVRRLEPGHWLTWRDGRIEVQQYWDVSFAPTPAARTDEAWVNEYRERLDEAVRMRLMSDVPLGVFLSGGIDSAAITALMSRHMSEPVRTFSVAFAEREANELRYARLVASRFGTDHHEVIINAGDFFRQLPRLVWHEDEPIAHPSSVPLFFVSQLAARHVKVVLTGEGSDETLAGYPWHRATVYNMRIGDWYHRSFPRSVRGVLGRLATGGLVPNGVRRRARRTALVLAPNLDSLVFENFGVFGPTAQAELFAPEIYDRIQSVDPYAGAHAALGRTDATSLLSKLLYVDLKTYLHELLMKQDQMSMAASIESRVPFLDHPLVEFCASMPDRMKLRGVTTKWILRQAMRGILPHEILSRRKMGFPTPVEGWFRGPWSNWLQDTVAGPRALARGLFDPDVVKRYINEHVAGDARHTERLWTLANLELWQRIFIDGEVPSEESVASGSAAAA